MESKENTSRPKIVPDEETDTSHLEALVNQDRNRSPLAILRSYTKRGAKGENCQDDTDQEDNQSGVKDLFLLKLEALIKKEVGSIRLLRK